MTCGHDERPRRAPADGEMILPASPMLRVVVETAGVLFVDKPPGLGFHTEAGQLGVLPLLRQMQQRGELSQCDRLFAVHRLDRVTSGLLMVAKTADAASELSALLRERRVDKYYVALSARRPKKKQGCVQGDMERSRRGQWKLTRGVAAPAITHFVSAALPQQDERLLRGFLLAPKTGRTHQLRVAMKSLGSPVLGDPLYADATAARTEDRAYLHAAALRLPSSPALVSAEEAHRLGARGGLLSVGCRPERGAEFCSPAFVDLFRSWFPGDQPPPADDKWFVGTAVASAPQYSGA